MEKEIDKVKSVLDDFSKKLVDLLKKGKGGADRVAKIAQMRIEISSLSRHRKNLFEDLGEAFYGSYKKPDRKGEARVAEIVSNLGELDRNIAELRKVVKASESGGKGAPKKRGPRPKTTAAKTGKRGRPSKAKTEAKPKRRGRPPKSKQPAAQ